MLQLKGKITPNQQNNKMTLNINGVNSTTTLL